MKKTYLSVVIPAYNEEINIRLGALDKVLRFLEKRKYSWELIIVDDGSSDSTSDLVDEFAQQNSNINVIHNRHFGKAQTVITGMKKARGKIVLFTDLDQATPINEIKKLLPWFDRGFDVVIGSRNSNREGAPLMRRLMASGFIFLRSIVLGLKGITDTQCGFKAFKKNTITNLISRLKLYQIGQGGSSGSMVTAGFDIEMLFLATRLGYKIKEVPVEWHYVETRRVNPIKDSWQGLMDIVNIRLNSIKGVYK